MHMVERDLKEIKKSLDRRGLTGPNSHLYWSDGYDWARSIGISESQIHHMKYEGHNARLFARQQPSPGQPTTPASEKPAKPTRQI